MNDRIIKVSLDDEAEMFSHFPASNFFEFSREYSTSLHTFTSDPYCKKENNILYIDRKIELSPRTVAVMTSNPLLKEDAFNVPVLYFHNIIQTPTPKHPTQKINFVLAKYQYSDMLINQNVNASIDSSYAKSCYAIIDNLIDLVSCVEHACIPISLIPLPEDLPIFRYECTPETIGELVKDLSPKSYFMSTEHVINAKSALSYYGNPLDFLFSSYTKFFMERETEEFTLDENGMMVPKKSLNKDLTDVE